MDRDDFFTRYPFMLSPLHLMNHHHGEVYLETPPHLYALNRELLRFHQAPGGTWLGINLPRRHGKTEYSSIGFPAWALLLNPNLEILVMGHSEVFAIESIGRKIRDVINKYGGAFGVKIREDVKAAGKWRIEGKHGGVHCFGPHTGGVGYEAKLYIIDDLIATKEQALSTDINEKNWDVFSGTIYGMLTNQTKLLVVGTRWSRRDIFGRLQRFCRSVGRPFPIVRYPALAVQSDVDPETGKDALGRRVGEALWPERVSKEAILGAKKEWENFWSAHYQQAPVEEEDSLFKPTTWPVWTDDGTPAAYRITSKSEPHAPTRYATTAVVGKDGVAAMIAVDWAYREKKKADRTAILVGGLLPNGDIMIRNCIARRFAVEQGPKELARVCRGYRPFVVGMEGHPAMVLECRRNGVPEPRQFQVGNIPKLVRAMTAIEMGNAGRLILPAEGASEYGPWVDDFKEEVGSFTGIDDDHDDIPDALAWMCKLAVEIAPEAYSGEPEVLTPAPNPFPDMPYMGGMG